MHTPHTTKHPHNRHPAGHSPAQVHAHSPGESKSMHKQHITKHQFISPHTQNIHSTSNKPKPKNHLKFLFVLGAIGIILILSSLAWQKYLTTSQLQNQVTNPELSDVAVKSIQWESEEKRLNSISGISASDVLTTQLQQQDIIISEAISIGLISPPDNYFALQEEKSEGFYQLKQSLLQQAKQEYSSKEARITGAIINVFFYNQKMPSIPFTEADTTAKTLLTTTRQNVLDGTLTPVEAIDSLREAPELPNLDFNYAHNTGMEFSNAKVSELFTDPVVISAVQNAASNPDTMISDVFRSPGTLEEFGLRYFSNNSRLNGHYFFIVLTDKTDGFYQSYDSWVDSIISETSDE
jgi:hypothetical protein